METTQIVKALRVCADPGADCESCPYFTVAHCFRAAMLDAADRLKKLNKEESQNERRKQP